MINNIIWSCHNFYTVNDEEYNDTDKQEINLKDN